MKKTLIIVIAYLLISPIVADIIFPYFGEFAKASFGILYILSFIASVLFFLVVFVNLCSEAKLLPDNLDEIIFGGKHD